MMKQAWRDFGEDKDFLYEWKFIDPGENILNLGGISLSVAVNGKERSYTLMFTG